MGKIEVFQRDGADVVVVRDFDLVLIALAVCPRLRAVAHLDLHILGEDILPVKERLKKPLHFIQRELSLIEGRENGNQHIGIVFNLIKVKVVFVVVMRALEVIQIRLQLCLHMTILRLRTLHGIVLTEVGSGDHRRGSRG